MENNGWTVRVRFSNTHDTGKKGGGGFQDTCGVGTFYGYKPLNQQGKIETTFQGDGIATIKLENCYEHHDHEGTVELLLGGNRLAVANAMEYKEYTFTYHKGDKLRIKEVGWAIIKLHSFELSCTGRLVIIQL